MKNKTLTKEDIENLTNALNVPKELTAGLVITNSSFAAVGKRLDLASIIGAAMQELLNNKVLDKELVETIVECLRYEDDDKKELIKKFMKACEISKEEVEEAINEEE